jgi:O-antigen ligase
MVGSLVSNSPITSFTRGAQGAIVPSDIVAIVLMAVFRLQSTQSMFCALVPGWYRAFRYFIVAAIFSAIAVTPFFVDLGAGGVLGNVKYTIGNVPVELLMALFTVFRVVMTVPFIAYAVRLTTDQDFARFTMKMVWAGIAVLALCKLVSVYGIADMGLYLSDREYQADRLLGYSKSETTRLLSMGVFLSVFLARKFRGVSLLYPLGALIMLSSLFFAGGRGSLFGVTAGFIFMILWGKLNSKIAITAALCLVCILLFFLSSYNYEYASPFLEVVNNPESNVRWIIWSLTWNYLYANPLSLITGVGIMNFKYALSQSGLSSFFFEHPHSDFLQALTELGIVGLLLFLSYLWRIGKEIHDQMKSANGVFYWQALCVASIFVTLVVAGCFEPCLFPYSGSGSLLRTIGIVFGIQTGLWLQTKARTATQQSDVHNRQSQVQFRNQSIGGSPGNCTP